MFRTFFQRIVAASEIAKTEAAASHVITESGLSEIFGQLQDERGMGSDKFRSSMAVPGDLRDMARLLLIGREINPIVALEIGSGYSTAALAQLMFLSESALSGQDFPNRNEHSFVVESLDESQEYISVTRARLPAQLASRVRFHQSSVSLTMVHDRYATIYDTFPNCLPDFIYLDGPSQRAAKNSINGFSLHGTFRMPMSADILLMEHYLEPGCVVLVDGRTANARFLLSNFQRSWLHHYDPIGDVHLMMMNEPPLGMVNRRKLQVRGLL
jgi:hypothetical protein